jgi:hypothetical protein
MEVTAERLLQCLSLPDHTYPYYLSSSQSLERKCRTISIDANSKDDALVQGFIGTGYIIIGTQIILENIAQIHSVPLLIALGGIGVIAAGVAAANFANYIKWDDYVWSDDKRLAYLNDKNYDIRSHYRKDMAGFEPVIAIDTYDNLRAAYRNRYRGLMLLNKMEKQGPFQNCIQKTKFDGGEVDISTDSCNDYYLDNRDCYYFLVVGTLDYDARKLTIHVKHVENVLHKLISWA